MKDKPAKTVAARKKKDKTAPEILTEVPPVESKALVDVPPIEEDCDVITEVPPVVENIIADVPVIAEGEMLTEATALDSRQVFSSNSTDEWAPAPNPRVSHALPRTTSPRSYTPEQIKKLRGEYSKRTLRARFGIFP